MREMTASEASRNFSALLDAVQGGETIIVSRGGRHIATVRPTPATSGDAFVELLHEWNEKRKAFAPDDDPGAMQRAIDEMRELVSSEYDTDPWAE